MAEALKGYMDKTVSIISIDGRNFTGKLKVINTIHQIITDFHLQGVDGLLNLVLEDTQEILAGGSRLPLGVHIVRGDSLCVVAGEGGPGLEPLQNLSSLQAALPGPGSSRGRR